MTHALLLILLLFAPRRQAPPAIQPEGVINAASQMPSQLPGGPIAPGSLIRILGLRLGPEKPALNGVSVQIHKDADVLDAKVVYASASRIDAVRPRSTPLGQLSLLRPATSFGGQRG